jgi:hypothetical protein
VTVAPLVVLADHDCVTTSRFAGRHAFRVRARLCVPYAELKTALPWTKAGVISYWPAAGPYVCVAGFQSIPIPFGLDANS